MCAHVYLCVCRYNVNIFAYGQTGSGKTHTMVGPPEWAQLIAGGGGAEDVNTNAAYESLR